MGPVEYMCAALFAAWVVFKIGVCSGEARLRQRLKSHADGVDPALARLCIALRTRNTDDAFASWHREKEDERSERVANVRKMIAAAPINQGDPMGLAPLAEAFQDYYDLARPKAATDASDPAK